MALTNSFPTEAAGGLSINDTRRVLAGLIARDAAGNPRTGVFRSSSGPLVTGTAGMAYQVGPFAAVTARSGAGVELVANDASTSVPTTAAPSANSRIDVIWARCLFGTDADTTNTPVLGVSQGQASGTPSKPSIPPGSLELATAQVTSENTATNSAVITQTFRFTTAAGGLVPVRNAVERDAWTPADGALARQLDNAVTYQRIAGAWVPMPVGEEVGTFTFEEKYRNHATYESLRLTATGKRARLRGIATIGQQTGFAPNTSYELAFIPPGWRPVGKAAFGPATTSPVASGYVSVWPDGAVRFALGSGGSHQADAWIIGFDIEWDRP